MFITHEVIQLMKHVSYMLTTVAQFMAGVVWTLLACYAARMAPDEHKRRAIAIEMIGTPLVLSLDVPGTLYDSPADGACVSAS